MTQTSIVKALRIKANIMSMSEQIAWGSDTELMRGAADEIECLKKSLSAIEGAAIHWEMDWEEEPKNIHTLIDRIYTHTKVLQHEDVQNEGKE